MNLEDICKKTIFVAENAAEIIRSHIDNADYAIDAKGKNDFVTEIDKKTEKFIVSELMQILPEAGFIAEEKSSQKVGEVYNWIVDPIDGTSNFIHGIYPCSVSIALKQNDEIVVGVVYEVGHKECFSAYKNGGAWLNGKRISVSKINALANAFVATGFPYNRFEVFRYKCTGCSSIGLGCRGYGIRCCRTLRCILRVRPETLRCGGRYNHFAGGRR